MNIAPSPIGLITSSPGIPRPTIRVLGPAVATGIPVNFVVPGGEDPAATFKDVESVACVALVDRLRDPAPDPPVVPGWEVDAGAGDGICAV